MLFLPKCLQMFAIEEGASSSFTYFALIFKMLTAFIQTHTQNIGNVLGHSNLGKRRKCDLDMEKFKVMKNNFCVELQI